MFEEKNLDEALQLYKQAQFLLPDVRTKGSAPKMFIKRWEAASDYGRAIGKLWIHAHVPGAWHEAERLSQTVAKRLPLEQSLAALSSLQDWHIRTPCETDEHVQVVRDALKLLDYQKVPTEDSEVIGAAIIWTDADALNYSTKLKSLAQDDDLGTPLAAGLIKSIHRWISNSRCSRMTPSRLKSIRKFKNFSQVQMAKKLLISRRHYIRYEKNEYPIPSKISDIVEKFGGAEYDLAYERKNKRVRASRLSAP